MSRVIFIELVSEAVFRVEESDGVIWQKFETDAVKVSFRRSKGRLRRRRRFGSGDVPLSIRRVS